MLGIMMWLQIVLGVSRCAQVAAKITDLYLGRVGGVDEADDPFVDTANRIGALHHIVGDLDRVAGVVLDVVVEEHPPTVLDFQSLLNAREEQSGPLGICGGALEGLVKLVAYAATLDIIQVPVHGPGDQFGVMAEHLLAEAVNTERGAGGVKSAGGQVLAWLEICECGARRGRAADGLGGNSGGGQLECGLNWVLT